MTLFTKDRFHLAIFQAIYRRHSDFILLLVLFITFRALALVAFRPGGLVLDFSDFYWYRSYAELTRQGYYPYDNLWMPYPPLFPVVMIAIYHLSVLLPPWTSPNLWFTLLLGGFFLLFEIGNFILLYLFALKLNEPVNQQDHKQSSPPTASRPPQPLLPIRVCWIYAAFFVPVYTLTGWFESYPIFFFLLSLYLLLQRRPYLSAFFTGVGTMIKLFPFFLIPVAIQQLSKHRYEIGVRNSKLEITKYTLTNPLAAAESQPAIYYSLLTVPFDIPRSVIYAAIFVTTVVVIALPFYWMNPSLILSSQQIMTGRQPWETVWALIDGNYDYGIPPLDMRDLSWTPDKALPTRIPWTLVTGLFGLLYFFFYTRPLNWTITRHVLAFTGFTLCLFMLWSKGYSPQWLGWPLFFIALLLPNLRGVIYTAILSLANIVEASFFFIMFPEEHWLLAITVLIRAFLLAALAVEFLWLIWPQVLTPRVKRIRAWGLGVFVAFLIVGSVVAGLHLGTSYFEIRLRQSPYKATITRLQGEQVKGALLLNSQTVYDWFYPYLRHDYLFFMLDDYATPGQSVENRTKVLLDSIAAKTDVLWIYDADAANTTPAEETLATWLSGRSPAHIQDIDGGRLYLFILK